MAERDWNRRELLRAGALAAPAAAAAAAAPALRLDRDVRVGLLGLEGHFGEAVRVAAENPRVRITAVEMSSERERARGGSLPALRGAARYDDYRELLEREELDAVCICDQNHRRAESVIACLEAGLPTAAEKPLALELDELERVRGTVESTGVALTMLLPMRFDPAYAAMRDIVAAGTIGEPIQLSGQKSYQLGERPDWMKRRETFGGTIPYIGCHVVDLLRFISGRDMVETSAFHDRVGFERIGEMENTAVIAYRLDNGGTADVRLDYLRPEAAGSHGDDRIRVAGSAGVVERQGGRVTLATDDEPPHEVTERPRPPALFANFLDHVFNGAEALLSLEDVFQVTRIVLQSREAADRRTVVRI